MTKFSAWQVFLNGLTGQQGGSRQWRDPQPKAHYDIIIVGGGAITTVTHFPAIGHWIGLDYIPGGMMPGKTKSWRRLIPSGKATLKSRLSRPIWSTRKENACMHNPVSALASVVYSIDCNYQRVKMR